MRKLVLFMSIVFLFWVQVVSAQTKTITGLVISSEDGLPIPGVSVVVMGTTIGAITAIDGKYQIAVPDDATILIYSFVGMKSQEVSINDRSKIDITLEVESIGMDEVVVTALGITREKKGITYAAENVSVEDMTKVAESNFVNNLAGKVSGLQVTQSNGSIGGSSRVLLRGWSSVTGNNQPLFVVDGVPINNGNYSSSVEGYNYSRGAIDYGNAAMDINPDNIENITVLKGGTAAALYGSRAANGAIIISTKTGKGKQKRVGVDFKSSVSLSSPLILPDYQNKYAQGYYNNGLDWVYTNWGYHPDESWGPEMDGRLERHPITGEMVPLTPKPNNRKDFYDTGVAYNNTISIAGQDDQFDYRFTWTNNDIKGIMPTSTYNKNFFSLNAGYSPTERLRISTSANFLKSSAHNRDQQGQTDGGINISFLWSARNFDYREMRNYKDEEGNYMGFWNSDWWDNPWFVLEQNPNDDSRTRFFGNAETQYKITNDLSIVGRIGIDTYRDDRHEKYAFGGVGTDHEYGGFIDYFVNVEEITSDIYLSYVKEISSDLDITAILGYNVNQQKFDDLRVEAEDLIIPDVFNLDNSRSEAKTQNYSTIRRLYGIYGSVNFGFKDYLFLDLTARNDWSSTLPKEGNSYFYPSAGLGYVFTNMIEIDNGILSYGKLRFNMSQVGNDPAPFQTEEIYRRTEIHDPLSDNFKFPLGNVYGYSVPDDKRNPNLKPEMQTSYEIGGEFKFLNNRIGVDVTYYKQSSKNQIIRHDVSAASGSTSKYINAGEIENKGIEAMLNLTPIKRGGFKWDIDINFTRNRNKVISLIDGVDAITLPYGFVSPSMQVRVGQPFGVMYGSYYEEDPNGNPVVDSNGLPQIENNPKKLGDPNPDWMGGIRNTFTYKGLSLSVLFDTKQGGDLFSQSIGILTHSGQVKETETLFGYTREDDFVIPNSVVKSIDEVTGAVTYTPNETTTTINDYYWNHLFAADSPNVFDASYIKLREITLSYSIPKNILNNIGLISDANVYFSGRNLLLFGTNMPHIDPEVDAGSTTSNLHGYEYANSPSTKNFTFGLNVSF